MSLGARPPGVTGESPGGGTGSYKTCREHRGVTLTRREKKCSFPLLRGAVNTNSAAGRSHLGTWQ